MRKNFGLPYKGSKSKLAERILGVFPKAEHLYDLFCGGSAIAHCAMTKGQYKHVHINDINQMMPMAFVKAVNGEFGDETRWISREDFFQLKDSDPYAAICFSFGNDLKTYCYGRNIEETKKALHYAIFFGSYELSDRLIGVDLRPIEKCATRQEKYLMVKRLIKEAYSRNTPPFNYHDAWPTARTDADCKTWNNWSDVRCCSFKKLGACQFAEPRKSQPHLRLQNMERLSRIQTFTPPEYRRWNMETKRGRLELTAYHRQTRVAC